MEIHDNETVQEGIDVNACSCRFQNFKVNLLDFSVPTDDNDSVLV